MCLTEIIAVVTARCDLHPCSEQHEQDDGGIIIIIIIRKIKKGKKNNSVNNNNYCSSVQYTRSRSTATTAAVVVVVNPLQQCGTDTVVTVARTVIFGRSVAAVGRSSSS